MTHVKDINEIVKKCTILLLDIEGTTTSISFVKDKLFPYAEENVKEFLDSQWESDDVKEAVAALRKLAIEDKEKSVEGVVAIPGEDASKDDQITALVNSVKWQMSEDRKAGALKLLQGLIWKQGYDKGDIKGHVYEDVQPALESWRAVEGKKVYIYSSGSVQAQKLLFGQSLSGNLLKYIDGHFDTAVGGKQEESSYKAIIEKIGCKAEDVLFLTDIVKEAEAARAAGLHVALVQREDGSPLPDSFPVLRNLSQLAHSNKRKPVHEEEKPAKIAKTDTEGDKSSIDLVPAESGKNLEKMEVEDEPIGNKPEDKEIPVKVDTVIEEVMNEPDEAQDCDIEPVVIEEITEKVEEKEAEKMEDEPLDTKLEFSADNSPDVELTTAVVTEIEEITDKQTNGDEVDVVEDVVPVVEEPPAEDLEELKNVGEVLEKECDEILSKVQDVTNLENIPVKPLLNTIAEETMETENLDSNDIVDKILDTEIEMEKEKNDIDESTVTEMEDETKPENASDKPVEEISNTEDLIEDKEKSVKTNGDAEKIDQNGSAEAKSLKDSNDVSSETEKCKNLDKTEENETNKSESKECTEQKDDRHVNGKATNGETKAKVNGDTNKENVDSRLSVQEKEVNRTNGNSKETLTEAVKEIPEIKVKTVTEVPAEPIEQPTDA